MQNIENSQSGRENVESGIPIRAYFSACINYWYWFVLSLIACCSLAFVVVKSLTQQYSAHAYILIKSDDQTGISGELQLFSDIGLGNKADVVENEIYVIKSTALIDAVVKQLGLSSQYYTKSLFRKVNIYGETPITVSITSEYPKDGLNIQIIPLSATEFSIYSEESKDTKWQTAKFGKEVVVVSGEDDEKNPIYSNIIVEKTDLFNEKVIGENIYVNITNPHKKAISIAETLDIQKADKETNVLALKLEGENFNMVKDILNNLIEAYNQDVINDKNRVARSTEAFIVDRIAAISKDLGGIDSEIETLKIRNSIPNISTQVADLLVTDGTRYKDAVAEVEMQLQLTKYIKEFMADMKKYDLIPANTGISDMGLESQITLYNTECLKYNKIAATSGEANPVTVDLEKSLTAMQENINRSIDSFIKTLQIKLKQAKAQEKKSDALISSVPTQEKEVTNVLRQQKIKEELYLYLLNKREENALQLAITEPNAKIIEHADGDELPIFPSTRNMLILGFLIGLLLPAGIIYLIFWIYSLDSKVHSRKDIEDISSVPILGELPCKRKDQKNEEIIVTENGRDRITEALRIIRGNMDYMLKRKTGLAPIIQMTSTLPHEGKSYVTINLALSCAHAGKKVIAIDLDFRKGNFSKYIDSKSMIGISAYLSGKIENIHDIIIKGSIHQNLDIISLGAIPPNPSDLLSSDRFTKMIDLLSKEYDLIVLDTVPYTVIADAQIVNHVADMTIYVMRDNMIEKNYIYEIDKMYRENKLRNIAILLTDINVDSKHYVYGHGYGYGYGYGQGYGYGYVEGEKTKKKKKFKIF